MEVYAEDGIDRNWFGESVDIENWSAHADAPIWKLFGTRDDCGLGMSVWAPQERGVYIWQAESEQPRALGTRSDIVYIGRAARGRDGNLAHRLRYHPLRWFDLQVTWRMCWSYDEAEELEDRLLRPYRSIHGQLPPDNKINAARRRR